jgi:surface polysaccharide O-acyltransferase-like enzyme
VDRRISWLRVIACFMVIALHVSAAAFGIWNEAWWAGNFYDSLMRGCVPLFLMITGATLLPKHEEIHVFFKKRFVRIIPPLVAWSIFYLWWLQHNGVQTGSWILAILNGPTMFHLWFFYALLGLYAIVPVLRKFYQNSSQQEQAWFIATWFLIASLIPAGQNVFFNLHCEGYLAFDKLSAVYHLSYFSGYVGYILLGAYLSQLKPHFKLGVSTFFIASGMTMLASYVLSRHFGKPCEFFFVYLSPLVVVAAGGLFFAVMSIKAGTPSKMLTILADCSLGIYGLHVFIIDPVFSSYGISTSVINSWLAIPVVSLGVFTFSFVVIYLLRLIKPLRIFI